MHHDPCDLDAGWALLHRAVGCGQSGIAAMATTAQPADSKLLAAAQLAQGSELLVYALRSSPHVGWTLHAAVTDSAGSGSQAQPAAEPLALDGDDELVAGTRVAAGSGDGVAAAVLLRHGLRGARCRVHLLRWQPGASAGALGTLTWDQDSQGVPQPLQLGGSFHGNAADDLVSVPGGGQHARCGASCAACPCILAGRVLLPSLAGCCCFRARGRPLTPGRQLLQAQWRAPPGWLPCCERGAGSSWQPATCCSLMASPRSRWGRRAPLSLKVRPAPAWQPAACCRDGLPWQPLPAPCGRGRVVARWWAPVALPCSWQRAEAGAVAVSGRRAPAGDTAQAAMAAAAAAAASGRGGVHSQPIARHGAPGGWAAASRQQAQQLGRRWRRRRGQQLGCSADSRPRHAFHQQHDDACGPALGSDGVV